MVEIYGGIVIEKFTCIRTPIVMCFVDGVFQEGMILFEQD